MTQEEAIKTVDRIFNYCEEIDCHLPEDEQTGYDMYPDIRAVIEYIQNTPEVVRCKDCKYSESVSKWKDFELGCMLRREYTTATDFCSQAERKEAK